ncbi:MAG TPA: DUF4174 domain-containing protein [Methylophaga aminisulfidivorans]|uniref:DUF4174 domain-containing protein n=2 Tax=root TaxID=1 RepID=A0A7C1ZIR2_9GAMM|nr:DUF4174 domain-containing protein [Methylophaga aminisulfidivorans]
MKSALLVSLLFLTPLFLKAEEKLLQSLADLQWKNRIILIQSTKDTISQQQLTTAETAIKDRDIVWFLLENDKLKTNYIGNVADTISNEVHSKLMTNDTSVILIGKDGGIKTLQSQLDLSELFSDIDVMPMRQREMQK